VEWAVTEKPSDTKSGIVFEELFLLVGWWGGGVSELNFMAIKVFVVLPGSEKMP
jgi:hypothetical protein